VKDLFHKFAAKVSNAVGTPRAFILAILIVIIWAATGPVFGFSDTWQLVINTGTTVVTFLMVFLIQNTQNRDSKAIHIKLDELLKAIKGARNTLVNLEEMPDEDIDNLQQEFRGLHEKYNRALERRNQKH